MNSRQRYQGVLDGTAVDFLPRIPILMQYAAEHIGSNYAHFAGDARVLVESNIRCATDFGFDQLSTISDPYRETQGFGGAIEYVPDGVPRCTHPLAEHKHLSRLQTPDPAKSTRMLDRVNAVRAYQQQCGDEYSIMGWIEGPAAEAATLRGTAQFLMDTVKDRSFLEDLMDLCLQVGIDFAQAQVRAGADTIGIGDAIASQVSPRTYERLILPREKKLVQAIKKMPATVRLHICGDITHLLPGIADLDIDIIDVDHMVDLPTVRKHVGDRVTISGNIDPVAGVHAGTPQSIRETIARSYAQVGNPYMVNAGCEIPSGTPPENLRALCEPLAYQG